MPATARRRIFGDVSRPVELVAEFVLDDGSQGFTNAGTEVGAEVDFGVAWIVETAPEMGTEVGPVGVSIG